MELFFVLLVSLISVGTVDTATHQQPAARVYNSQRVVASAHDGKIALRGVAPIATNVVVITEPYSYYVHHGVGGDTLPGQGYKSR